MPVILALGTGGLPQAGGWPENIQSPDMAIAPTHPPTAVANASDFCFFFAYVFSLCLIFAPSREMLTNVPRH